MAENVDIQIQARSPKEHHAGGGAPNYGATLLAGMLFGLIGWFYFIAIQPGFKGGVFVTAILGALFFGQLVVLIRELCQLVKSLKTAAPDAGGADFNPSPSRSFAYKVITLILVFSALIYGMGVYVAAVFFIFTYLFFFRRKSWARSLAMTAGIAAFGLYGLSYIVSVPLWVGVSPALVPGFVGGAISPVW